MVSETTTPRIETAVRPRTWLPGVRRHALRTIEPRRPGFRNAFAELWRYRRYTLFFGWMYSTRISTRTWLGVLWLPLKPAMNVASKILVFGGLAGISAGKTPYPIFFLTATAAWGLFGESARWGTRCLDINRSMLKSLHIPRLVLVVAAVIPALVDFALNCGMALIGLTYYYIRAHTLYLELTWMSIVQVAGGMLLLLGLGVGVGVVTAGTAARARDIRYGLTYFLSFVYFVTPVIYPFSTIPNKYKPLAELNPATGAMQLFKIGLFGGHDLSPKALAASIIAVLLLWIPGIWLVQRVEVRDW